MNTSIKKLLLNIVPRLKMFYGYCCTKLPKISFFEYLFRNNRAQHGCLYWPRDKSCVVIGKEKIYVGKNSNIGRVNSYIQGNGGIYIGDYTRFGPSIGLMSSNHDLYVQYEHHEKPIIIGDYCWLGRGVNVMGGVVLGTRTIVGAGAVVTKSFPEGYCVIGGNPAKIIKYLDKDKFEPWRYPAEYYGYLTEQQFERYKKRYLKLPPEIEEVVNRKH